MNQENLHYFARHELLSYFKENGDTEAKRRIWRPLSTKEYAYSKQAWTRKKTAVHSALCEAEAAIAAELGEVRKKRSPQRVRFKRH